MANPLIEASKLSVRDAWTELNALGRALSEPAGRPAVIISTELAHLLAERCEFPDTPWAREELAELGVAASADYRQSPSEPSSEFPSTRFDVWADDFLTNRYATDGQYRVFSELWDQHRGSIDGRLSGFLGFVALVYQVQQDADLFEPPRDLEGKYARYLVDDDVRNFMDAWYGFSAASSYEISVTDLRMHRVGTTSFILKAWTNSAIKALPETELALKCLIPRFSEIEPVRIATETYRTVMKQVRRAGGESVPHVKDYDAHRFIAMDFIGGATLHERTLDLLGKYAEEGDVEGILSNQDAVAYIKATAAQLAQALSSLAKYGYRHLDLSPYNVMSSGDGLVLLDFGRNYLVDEILRSGDAYERVVLYIAPELTRDPTVDEFTCDLYSLGVIVLDLVTGGGLVRSTINHRLMSLWRVSPGLAELIEQLTANEPDRRTAITPVLEDAAAPQDVQTGAKAQELYEAVAKRLAEEIDIATASIRGVEVDDFLHPEGMSMTLADYLMVKPPEVGALFKAAGALTSSERPDSAKARHFEWLGWLSRLYILIWTLIFVPALALTVSDLIVTAGKEAPSDGFTGWVAENTRMVIGQPLQNIPGRAIAVTTALIAVAYYMNLFAMLDLRRLRNIEGLSRAEQFWCRAAPFTTRVLPLVALCSQGLVVFYDPRLWPYTAGIGGLLVSANNWIWRRIVGIARRRLGKGDRLAGDLADFEKSFRTWWWLMGLYSLGVLVAGLLVRAGVAHDEAIYAVVIAGGVNLAKIYAINVTRDAGNVRAHLARSVMGVGRVRMRTAQ